MFSDTIFYSLTLKKNKSSNDVFEKIKKKVKSTGATAKWNVFKKNNSILIDFGDGKSETFFLPFNDNEAGGCCKVAFPMGGEMFENEKKIEWKTLILIIHSLKPLCSEILIDDDYDIAQEYFNSLEYKFSIRDLNPNEITRLDRLFKSGYTNYEAFLFKIFSEDTGREYPQKLEDAINQGVKLREPFPLISALWETYIYETSTLKKKCLREIYKNDVKFVNEKIYVNGDPPAEVYTFSLGIGRLFSCYDFIDNTWGRGANVTKYHIDKFEPIFQSADDYEKCKLAYQFMMSVYEYCKFVFVGKDIINTMVSEYEKRV